MSLPVNGIINNLKRFPIKNLSILGFIENNPIDLIESAGESLVIKGRSDRDWHYWFSENESEFLSLLEKIKDEAVFYGALEDWMVPYVAALGEVEWTLPMLNYYLKPEVLLPENKMHVRSLTPEDFPFIIENSHYKQFLSEEYLSQRVTGSYSAGIEIDGVLTAWGMTHDDGSIGVVHVMDDFRGKGLGKEIVISLAQQGRAKDKIPFAQIEKTNTPSIRLFEKLGFIPDRQLTWMKVVRRSMSA